MYAIQYNLQAQLFVICKQQVLQVKFQNMN